MHVIIHYGEIALKGRNREYFEKKLLDNIRERLSFFAPAALLSAKKISGAILLELSSEGERECEKVQKALEHVPGIVNFAFASRFGQDLEELKEGVEKFFSDGHFETFRITTRRSDKRFPLTSEELNRQLGAHIFHKFSGRKKVLLKGAERECHVELVNGEAFIFAQKLNGPGGMPTGTSGTVLALISGGFDSPVAAWHLIRRGTTAIFVHFHSMPFTSRSSIEKVESLVQKLASFQGPSRLYLVPLAAAQKEITVKCPDKLKIIIQRRLMLRIAEEIASQEKALALVTGDSLAQVASQTLENIFATNEAASLPIFRPLIGLDKEDIMRQAQKIETYDISKLPHDDCCTRLMPQKPETKAKISEVLLAEKSLDIKMLTQNALERTEKIFISATKNSA